MKKIVSLILIVLILGLVGCNSTEREYYDDIVIDLQDSTGKIIIKEWRYLQGSGAEVYYQENDTDQVLLGNTTGGDDGFCPFKEVLYELTQDGNSVKSNGVLIPQTRIVGYHTLGILTSFVNSSIVKNT